MLFYQIYSFSVVQGVIILLLFFFLFVLFLANVFLFFLTFASFVTTVAARNQNKLSLNRSYRTLVTLERERGKRGVIDWEMHSQDHDSSVVSSFPGNTPTNFLLMLLLLLLLLSSNPSFCLPKRIGENFRNFDRKRLFSVGNVSFRVFWRAVKIGERQIHPTPDRTFLPKNYFGIFRSN